MKIKTLLIANRGEIACRVIKTAKQLGMKTVAIFSESDAQSLHVRMADEAYRLDGNTAQETYLNQEKFLNIAKSAQADAIHPGYGFLSENTEFAKKIESAGMVFVGAPAKAIELMGEKDAAKRFMMQHHVPVIPGYQQDNQDETFLLKQANSIGYPILIKAAAGGGGKGMRIVEEEASFLKQLSAAKREAKSSFGNDKVILEKYLVCPRHIEVQIIADEHGNVLHLFERDCSIQRRYQKIIEEAPAPQLSALVRKEITKTAVQAARAIKYRGAGTLEFLLDNTENFYFMEMNTRLQVEHPVTEMITGLDLVALQLQVAQGEPLALTQEEITITGHAIEARIYAEDCDHDFMPATGTINFLEWPPQDDGIRLDTGIDQGSKITPFYDPMIAKLIAHGKDRDEAIDKLKAALNLTRLYGVKNNIVYLLKILETQPFQQGKIHTHFITEHTSNFKEQEHAKAWLAAALFYLYYSRLEVEKNFSPCDLQSPWYEYSLFRVNLSAHQEIKIQYADTTRTYTAAYEQDYFILHHNHEHYRLKGKIEKDSLTMFLNGSLLEVFFHYHEGRLALHHPKFRALVKFPEITHENQYSDEVMQAMQSPLPGTIIAVYTKAGEQVQTGQSLMAIEAMKMEHTIVAPKNGKIKNIFYSVGDMVEEGSELLEFDSVNETA